MTPELIKKAFTATGICPPDPTPVLKKFKPATPKVSSSDEDSTSPLSELDWVKIYSLIRHISRGERSRVVRRLNKTLHQLVVENRLLRNEIKGLTEELCRRGERQKSYPLKRRERLDTPHGGAVFWSPRKLRQAREQWAEKQQKRDQEKLQKTRISELREQARLYKLKVTQEKRAAREAAKEVRMKEKAEKEAERARKKLNNNTKKPIRQSQNGKRKASKVNNNRNKRQKRVVDSVVDEGEASGAAPASPPRVTRHGRNIKLPAKYK
ncbi:hypothetical protein L13192_06567 [Pyrenophora tritici-repentis]|nr:hypothetical protein L13192_06567 [Pyrenophora tritici-repentis]